MLIADRNGMLVRKPLPYDAEVAWIESTGTQWIDTGIHATQNTTAKIKCAWMTTTNDNTVFGADNGNTWTGFILMQNTGIRFIKGGPTNIFSQRWNQFVSGQTYDIECSQNGVVIDGTLYSFNGTPTAEFYVNKPISLFGWWRQTQPWGSNVQIAYVQFFENGMLVRDMIPVRFTNENDQPEGAMYDRLGVGGMNPDGSPRTDGLYRNRGTGAFVFPTA